MIGWLRRYDDVISRGMRQILLRVEANAEIGRGHAVRSAALVDALAWDEPPIIVGDGSELQSLFPNAEIEPRERFAELAAEASLVIIDHPNPRVADLEIPGLKVVIDDGGEVASANIVVAGSGPPSRYAYPKLGEEVLRLCGPRYALLRPAFSKGRRITDEQSERGLLLAAGSGGNAARWLIGVLENAPGMPGRPSIDVVVGASFAEPERLRMLCEEGGHWLGCNLSASALADRLSTASVAVVTGGMIVPEVLALGVPCVAFPNEMELVEEIAWLDRLHALRGLDPRGAPADTWLRVGELLSDVRQAEALAVSGMRLFDGRGVNRVSAAIEARLSGVNH